MAGNLASLGEVRFDGGQMVLDMHHGGGEQRFRRVEKFAPVNTSAKRGVDNDNSVAGIMVASAIDAADNAARRVTSMNNMKMIGLAMHLYAADHKSFPPAYSTGKDGKPLLSWRVLILPYMEYSSLYNCFHLDEPWDSDHNKQFADTSITEFQTPEKKPSKAFRKGKANYLVVRGKQTMFPGSKPVAPYETSEAGANTIITVEVSDEHAVIWTKPDDFEYVAGNPMKGLGGVWENGFLAGFANGYIRLVPNSVDPKTLEAYFTWKGGKVADPEHR